MWIAQISDPHIRPTGVLYKDVLDPVAALTAAIDQINALDPLPDVVLLTGDIVDEGAPAEYAAARSVLAGLKPRLLVIPGNHDEAVAFRAAFADSPYLPPSWPFHYCDEVGAVRIVAVDVTVPGYHHGDFTDAAAEWLMQALTPDRPTIVMMHQPPIITGIPYLDKYNCRGAERLESIVARFPSVQRILCGHVHRSMVTSFAGKVLCTAPSTATAIALRPTPDSVPGSFQEPPGFLLHHWCATRGMLTHSVPVGHFPGPFPFA